MFTRPAKAITRQIPMFTSRAELVDQVLSRVIRLKSAQVRNQRRIRQFTRAVFLVVGEAE